jgi:hypothetical protein
MFVRWKDNGEGKISAVLVKSVRVNGVPRQKTVRFLSSVKHRYYIGDDEYRLKFWDRLRYKLALSHIEGEITEEQQKEIELKIKQTVPFPGKKFLDKRAKEGDLSDAWGYNIPLERQVRASIQRLIYGKPKQWKEDEEA